MGTGPDTFVTSLPYLNNLAVADDNPASADCFNDMLEIIAVASYSKSLRKSSSVMPSCLRIS